MDETLEANDPPIVIPEILEEPICNVQRPKRNRDQGDGGLAHGFAK
jgi:hypothetical protein